MLGKTLDNLSQLLQIDPAIIPNIITLLIVVVLIYVGLKGSLQFTSILLIYALTMVVLSILGIDSVFNIVTMIIRAIKLVIQFFIYG